MEWVIDRYIYILYIYVYIYNYPLSILYRHHIDIISNIHIPSIYLSIYIYIYIYPYIHPSPPLHAPSSLWSSMRRLWTPPTANSRGPAPSRCRLAWVKAMEMMAFCGFYMLFAMEIVFLPWKIVFLHIIYHWKCCFRCQLDVEKSNFSRLVIPLVARWNFRNEQFAHVELSWN